jgi:hypothetical protein
VDSKRFDNWTRDRALRLSRRGALRLAGAGTAAVVLPSAAANALAEATCKLTVHAETAGGPSAPESYDGVLDFTLGSDGAFTEASFTPASGPSQSVSGLAIGRAIDFQIELSGNQLLVFAGAGDQPVGSCKGALGGLFSGPQPGDLGVWEATAGSGSSSTAPPLGSGQSGSSSSSSASGSNCQSPQTPCGPNCCPGGATCTNSTTGLCSCPNGTEQCGNNCVPSCSDGQPIDLDSCACPPAEAACIPNQSTCQNHGQCCSGYCGGGTCFDCAGKVCGDFGCVDPTRDSQNCGNCGVVCVSPQVCNNGVCGCGSDGTPCVFDSECCSQVCFVSTCQTCSNILSSGPGAPSAPMTFCGPGICADLRTDIDHCGACFNACPRTSGGIVCDTGVCHDINSDPNYCGFSAEVCGPGKICHLGDCVPG